MGTNTQPGDMRLTWLSVIQPVGRCQQYANLAQQGTREVDQTAMCGWVVDLRLDHGGEIFPMLADVGPILGEGPAGAFVAPGQRITWVYQNGEALQESGRQTFLAPGAQVADPYHLKRPWPPVAVLTSPLTASAGEAVVVAFRGRPNTRSFGEPTAGIPTANGSKVMSDGAVIVLTEAFDADRTGHVYDSAIAPDQPVSPNWTLLGTPQDSVLQAAITWLQNQPGCHN